jgi:plasmid stability protein
VGLRNITFSLPADLVRQAKVYAAERDTTINALVRELLQDAIVREGRARIAADRLLALADQGPYFKTDPGSIPREELYERR